MAFEEAEMGALRRNIEELVATLESLKESGSDVDTHGFVDAPDDFSHRSAFAWETVEVEVVDEVNRVYRFDEDAHLNVWS